MPRITLELSAALFTKAKTVAEETGLTIEDVVTEWAERGGNKDLLALIGPGPFPIYTPFEYGDEAAYILMQMLNKHRSDDDLSPA